MRRRPACRSTTAVPPTEHRLDQALAEHGILASVGSVGDAYDNAPAENFVDSFRLSDSLHLWPARDATEPHVLAPRRGGSELTGATARFWAGCSRNVATAPMARSTASPFPSRTVRRRDQLARSSAALCYGNTADVALVCRSRRLKGPRSGTEGSRRGAVWARANHEPSSADTSRSTARCRITTFSISCTI
jgi:hypothetical protein